MELRDYLHKHRLKCTDFAELIDYHPDYINHIANYRIRPGPHLARLIERTTKFEVTAKELLNAKYQKVNTKKLDHVV